MNFINFIVLFTLFSMTMSALSGPSKWNNHKIRNTSFKFIIFKEKKIPKILNYIKKKYDIYYNKAIISVSNGITEYENLSSEDKQILDFIFSLIIG